MRPSLSISRRSMKTRLGRRAASERARLARYEARRTLYALERARQCRDKASEARAYADAVAADSERRQAQKALLAIPDEGALQRYEARARLRREFRRSRP